MQQATKSINTDVKNAQPGMTVRPQSRYLQYNGFFPGRYNYSTIPSHLAMISG